MPPRRSTRIKAAAVPPAVKIQPTTPKRSKRKATAKKPTIKKRRTGLSTAIVPTAALGVIDPESNIDGTIEVLDNEPCDVMLVLVDPAKHMDKYFVLQFIERVDGTFVVYTRWGRTGTSGQGMEEDVDGYDDAVKAFEKKFKQKTGLTWENRNDPTTGKKYRFINQNFAAKQAGFVGAKWQYWVDDNVDGKTQDWYDYTPEGSAQAERLFQEHTLNPSYTNRYVDSGAWTYDVDLVLMIQTNVKHANNTSRRIRRCCNDDEEDGALPQSIAFNTTRVSVPTSPVKSANIVTPTSSPVKPQPVASTTVKTETTQPDVKTETTQAPPVDGDIDLFYPSIPSSTLTVAKDDDDEWYDVVLNQCNITGGNNNNKYYRLQLLDNQSGNFYVWMKWGRVGESPKASAKDLKGPFATVDAAFKIFAKKYKDKTANAWGAETFVPKKKKYTRIQIDNDVEVKDEFKMVNVKSENIEYLPSCLDPTTKELIDVLFSEETRDEALRSFNLDLKRLPLGVPSKQQIQIGVDVLNEIEDKLSGGEVSDSYAELSSRFYTAIPHSFGRQRPPTINRQDSLQERYDMTNILLDMFSTNEVLRKLEKKVDTETKKIPCPSDSHYDSLSTNLSLVAKKTKEFKTIQQYFDVTKGGYSNAELLNAWQVDRHGEEKRYSKFDGVSNRKLLWHGTNIAVAAPIITSGLRIMPHSGGRVGAGIYLASMHEKSASYTSAYGAKFACMFLCESALGKQHIVTSDGCHASGLKKAPAGTNSVHAVGTHTPKSWTTMKIEDQYVFVPKAPGGNSGVSSSFHHDEYLVYDEAQVRIRYVVTVKL